MLKLALALPKCDSTQTEFRSFVDFSCLRVNCISRTRNQVSQIEGTQCSRCVRVRVCSCVCLCIDCTLLDSPIPP